MPEYPPKRPHSQSPSPFRREMPSPAGTGPTSPPYNPALDINDEDEAFDQPYPLNHAPFNRDRERPSVYGKQFKPEPLPQNTSRGSNYGVYAMPDYSGYPSDSPAFHNNHSTQKLHDVSRSSTSPSLPSPSISSTSALQKSGAPSGKQNLTTPSAPPPPMSPFDFNDDQDDQISFNDDQSIVTFSSDKAKKTVGAWLLWPKVPSGYIDALKITQDPVVNIKELPYTYQQNFTLTIYIDNYNILPLRLNQIDVVGRDPNGRSIDLGKGQATNIRLRSKALTSFDVPFQLDYTFGNTTDLIWTHLAQACVPNLIPSPNKYNMPMSFIVSLHIPEITWISKVPQATYKYDYVCN
ncbi:hypothetical protein K493DRAFT_407930 [Basidiobolus meristosporus CBS 931.73]|uniref:Uncharacterized protein n=1 Tax=Basidiobolus meristosporus CBS 931.73 TaxID=1314790 RepID=A0A1Y1Y9X5_9FUNG|nr:hypothetical protein K493DRAFT_407930 [Basidiobolus meristosporus CBS 931.73]|eukprot:ORX94556.1 hypothetical protein K493DRAFT_407930 [Basidiobolus meristosporus CBS 931.73]